MLKYCIKGTYSVFVRRGVTGEFLNRLTTARMSVSRHKEIASLGSGSCQYYDRSCTIAAGDPSRTRSLPSPGFRAFERGT